MKLYQSVTVCLALITGIAADGCFAQTALRGAERRLGQAKKKQHGVRRSVSFESRRCCFTDDRNAHDELI
ncbi:hypothetical protein PQR53_22365 [Paraburkholderia fungorum]|uniref:hypothetical protein n=1 Tax=Paraburkholderia fungorum TaxID=134537 RepID=UPI0038BD5AB6